MNITNTFHSLSSRDYQRTTCNDFGNTYFRSGEVRGDDYIRSVGQNDLHTSSQKCGYLSFDVAEHQADRLTGLQYMWVRWCRTVIDACYRLC